MKFWGTLFTIALISLAGYTLYLHALTPCDTVLEYSIGEFDSEFGLNKNEFKGLVADAEVVWEKAAGKELFRFEEGAPFVINLIYDERQRATVAKQRTESGLDEAETVLDRLDKKLASFRADYEQRASAFNSMKAKFENDSAEYESRVAYWNARGGAPQAEYDKLEAERMSLNSTASRLNAEVNELNAMADDLNDLVEDRNRAAQSYNRAAETYNQTYGDRAEFNQAEYDGEAITVFQFDNRSSLVMALAHEFGHALDMDHVDTAESLMYYLRDSDNTPASPRLSAEDRAELARVCPTGNFFEKIFAKVSEFL